MIKNGLISGVESPNQSRLAQIFHEDIVAFLPLLVQHRLWGLLQKVREILVQHLTSLCMLTQPRVAFHYVLRQAVIFLAIINQLLQHAVQHCRNRKESLNCRTYVAQTLFVTQNLLNYESSYSLRQSLSILHNSETKRYYFSLHKECDGKGIRLLDKCPDDSEGSDPQIFKYLAFGGGVQERIEKQWQMSLEELLPGEWMKGKTLQQPHNKADSIR